MPDRSHPEMDDPAAHTDDAPEPGYDGGGPMPAYEDKPEWDRDEASRDPSAPDPAGFEGKPFGVYDPEQQEQRDRRAS